MINEITIVGYDSYGGFTFQKVKITKQQMAEIKKSTIPLNTWEKLREKQKSKRNFVKW